jgi:uncharacterized membrane protein
MLSTLILYAAAAILFLVLDLVWLGIVAKEIYASEIGGLLRKDFNLVAATAFYLIFLAGLTYFVLVPAHQAGSIVRALIAGAVFGFVTYATYDLTNLATLQGFTTRIALIDMAWGTTLSALVSAGAVAIALRIG